MAVDTVGRFRWQVFYVEGEENPYRAYGTREENGRITITYDFAQATADLLVAAIQIAMGITP